jgi:ribosomal peptide maturation radical SAM protein 1
MTGQINSSAALLRGIKHQSPDILTIIGGPCCTGEMAEGIVSLAEEIDYVFSGESEKTLLTFLQQGAAQRDALQRIIREEPLSDLDDLPIPDYSIFTRQAEAFLGKDAPGIKIWYETSRGCWWAQHAKCTFCSEYRPNYRQKSVKKVLHDMTHISTNYPGQMLFIADNIMPKSYRDELLPELSRRDNLPEIAYHIRASCDLSEVLRYKQAKITAVLPGIESFATPLLKLMNKGMTGRQHLYFLRNAMSAGMYCDWFLLWGFPGDQLAWYQDILRLLPLIRHLQPPRRFLPMFLARFSEYLDHPQTFEIQKSRPWAAYEQIFPEGAEVEKLAYWYAADFPSESYEHPEIISEIAHEVVVWQQTWKQTKLMLKSFLGNDLIYDTRNGEKRTHVLEPQRARTIMTYQEYDDSETLRWAIEHKLGVVWDSWYVPLVTAEPDV